MKFNNLLSATLFAGLFTMVSCSQEELGGQPQNDGKNLLQITVTDAGVFGETQSRAIEEGYKTTFEAGDMIGVYGTKNGSTVVENHKFTYKEDGTWEPNGRGIEFIEEDMEEMKFYAYYPYQSEGADFDSSAGLKGDPFANTVNTWEIGADLDVNYTNYDLMTSGVTEITSTGALGVVNFKLKHRMSIAAIELPGKVYNFTNEDPVIDSYKLPAVPGEFKVVQGEEKIVKPYYDKKNDLYRILVKPNVEYKVVGTYTLEKRKEYESEFVTGLAGKARRFKLKGSIVTDHNLQAGDYYCADGSIVGKDVEKAPANAIGVVYFVGNPQPSVLYPKKYTEFKDVLRRDFPNCIHGLIIALNDANDGATSKFSGDKKQDVDNWIKANHSEYISIASNPITTDILGYNHTKAMQLSQSDDEIKKRSDTMCNILAEFETMNSVPNTASNWFCPSFGDFNNVIKNYEAISNSIVKANGSLDQYATDGTLNNKNAYWTSSVRNWVGAQWVTGLNQNEEDGKIAAMATCNSGGTTQHFRFCLAF